MAELMLVFLRLSAGLVLFSVLVGLSPGAVAQDLDGALHEQVVMVPKKGSLFTVELETTIYRPPGEGPFPVVVINHGKSLGPAQMQARYRPAIAARFFLQRGYAVVVPMRQGFSKSVGSYMGVGCNVESNGLMQAMDVKAVLDYVIAQPWADKDRLLVMGQSHGGWTTLAFGTLNYPGVKGLVNFAGGLRQDGCAAWEGNLARAAAEYGKTSRLSSLWFYGDNDSYFRPTTFRAMFDGYVSAGAKAELIAFGVFGNDSHAMFGSRAGEAIWEPRVEAFMRQIGLSTDVVFPEFASNRRPIPPPTGFAPLDDVDRLPFLKDSGREGYKKYLTKQFPRAFAMSSNGAWGWAEMGDDPLDRALASCNKHAREQACRLYSVDNDVVWTQE